MENNKNYLISLIIPIRNNPELFHKLISTVLNQTRNCVEIIAVDSSTKEFLNIDKQHIKLFNEEKIKHIIKSGETFGSATEIGIKNATGNLTFLLFNKQQWKKDEEEKNGFLKFVTKIKRD